MSDKSYKQSTCDTPAPHIRLRPINEARSKPVIKKEESNVMKIFRASKSTRELKGVKLIPLEVLPVKLHEASRQ